MSETVEGAYSWVEGVRVGANVSAVATSKMNLGRVMLSSEV